MITTVIFDLDDTLYDEIDYCKSGFMAVAEFLVEVSQNHSAQNIFEAFWQQFTAGNHTTTFNVALESLAIEYDNELITQIVNVYRGHTPNIQLPAESREVLDILLRKYDLALLTDGFLPAQQLKVQALDIDHYFKHIVYTEELGREFWKPSPVGFEELIKVLKIKPENAVYVADNCKKDFIAPNKLGLGSVQLMRGAGIHNESSNESGTEPQYVIHELSELPTFLGKL